MLLCGFIVVKYFRHQLGTAFTNMSWAWKKSMRSCAKINIKSGHDLANVTTTVETSASMCRSWIIKIIIKAKRMINFQLCVHKHAVKWVSVALTHWGRVTHTCVDQITIIVSDNGLSPDRRQAIIWTNAGLLLIGPLGTNISEILIEILTFSFKKMRLKV